MLDFLTMSLCNAIPRPICPPNADSTPAYHSLYGYTQSTQPYLIHKWQCSLSCPNIWKNHKFVLYWAHLILYWFSLPRHDICQIFYTSTVSQILKFTRGKAHKLRHFSLLIWKFGNYIHIIWLISQFLSIYAHFILNLWLKWLKIPKQNSIILI